MRQNLTDLAIKKLKPRDARYDVWDAKVPNLGLRVFPSGAKSFFLAYYLNQHKRRDTIGRYPEITLTDARRIALERKTALAHGRDPQVASGDQCFSAILPQFIQLHCERFNKPSTQRGTKKLLENYCLPHWRSIPIHKINRSHILAVLDGIVARGRHATANNCYAAISKFFNWCLSRGLIEANPCASVQRPSKTKTRDRVLCDDEIGAVWRAAQQIGYPYGTIISLLLLTGARRGEIANLTRDNINADTIHIAETKNNRPHDLPITPLARTILGQVPDTSKDRLFPANGNPENAFSGFSKCKRHLDALCPMPHWRIHDLRRSAATHMAQLGVQPHIIERVLNHATGTISGVAAIYNRHAYADEMEQALLLWHNKIESLSKAA